jgi:hypothetical protein
MKREQEIEIAGRAIWDAEAGDCSKDCRWGQNRADCWCQENSLDLAKKALEALDKERRSVCKRIARFVMGTGELEE